MKEKNLLQSAAARRTRRVPAPSLPLEQIYADTELRSPGFVMASYHNHPYYELYYVEKGACRFFIDNDLYDLHEGDFLLIPPRTPHYTRYLFGECRRTCLFFREEDPEAAVREGFPPLQRGESAARAGAAIFTMPLSYRGRTEAHMRRMTTELQIQDEKSEWMLHFLLQELLLLCGRHCSFPEKTPANIHTSDRQILAAARFMTEHFREPVTAGMIADAAGFSPNYFSRRFREATGMRVHEYLSLLRLENAAMELLSTQDRITEIALRNGFSDSNYFKDAFRKMYGVSPREYRKG